MKETEECSREELEAFIGLEAKRPYFSKVLDKYTSNNTNIVQWNNAAFLLGPFYLMYRKCFILSIIIALAYSSIIFLIPLPLSLLVLLLLMILLGLFGTNLYLKHIEKEINTLREYNYMKSEEDFHKILQSKGGTSFMAGSILYFIMVILLWIYIFK